MKGSAMQRGIWGAVVALSGLLNGCAVLTVDVDVYKGSLVNEEHVQLHQLVALASGVKPMLIHLRDNIEWPEKDGNPPMYSTWHQFGHVIPPTNITDYNFFRKPHARRVNAILSLYEDLNSPDLVPYGKSLSEALERLKRAKLDFEPSEKEDQAIFASIASGFRPDKELGPDLELLMSAYRELLIPFSVGREGEPRRKVGKLMDALLIIAGKNNNNKEQGKEKDEPRKGLEIELIKEWKGTDYYREKDSLYERRLPFRAVWKFLGEGEKNTLLSKVTRQLCAEGNQGDRACNELSVRTKELADAYWDTRQAIREIWEESLSLLIRIERLEKEDPSRYRALRENVIALAVELTNVRQIGSALDRLRDNGKCSVLENALDRGLICEAPNSDVKMEWNEANVKANPERFEVILRRALSATPADMAHFLLDLDSLEKKAVLQGENTVSNLAKIANKDDLQRVVRLGLNHSYVDDGKLQDSQKIFQSVNAVSRNLAQGFERGRLLEGIHTLTEYYLKSHDDAAGSAEKENEKKLLDVLVEFAQKVLFLANHEGLASPPGTPGLITGGIEKLNRGLFGDYVTDGRWSPYRRLKDFLYEVELSEEKKAQYIRVLQAVGNSILFSANELRERERHRVAGENKVKAEVAAVNLSRSPDPRKVLDDLLRELQVEKDNADKQLVEAKAQQAALPLKIGNSTPPLTGLRADAKAARDVLDAAKQTLATYQSSNNELKAIHGVLTDEAVKNIKAQWTSEGKETADSLSAFLHGSDGLTGKIANALTARQSTSTPEEIQRFADADGYVKDPKTERSFQARRAQDGHTSMKRADLLDSFVKHVRRLENDREGREAKYDQDRDQKDKEHKQIENEIARLEAELKQVAALVLKLPKDAAAFETARAVIARVKPDVLQDVEKHRQFVSPSAVYLLVATHLSKAEAAKSNDTDKKPFQEAQTVLSGRIPPAGGPQLDPNKDYKSPIAVMDELIPLLRHRQIDAVEQHGKGSDQDKKATEALESAYQHRAGMIYIRPSSAYLRTSFPSTSLQDDPNLAWDNMLLQQGIRNLPFSSQLRDILDPAVQQNRLLTAELDKQYWQNINRVRVSGTGFTNQVVAKDDVGNWYVKQYYGDTKDIINSAKNLALYNLGMKLPIDLAGELKEESKPAGDAKSEAGAESPPLNRVLEKHRNAYQAKTTEASTRLEELHSKISINTVYDQIVNAWGKIDDLKDAGSSMDALKGALNIAIQEWDEAIKALKKKPDQDQGQLIIKDLWALSKLDKSLSVKIQEIDKDSVKTDEVRLTAIKNKAKAAVSRVVGPIVMDMLKDRKQTLDSYEQAIMFIGDATNPKE